tara:strand:- start:323 stop:559 length:237 start_codon:yes stop_codon:yes gene_type:complete
MSDPVRAGDAPIGIEVVAGKSYFWCTCGQSQGQPFCDGSHKDTDFVPQKYKATDNTKIWFCACKSTSSQPLCDGSHKS